MTPSSSKTPRVKPSPTKPATRRTPHKRPTTAPAATLQPAKPKPDPNLAIPPPKLLTNRFSLNLAEAPDPVSAKPTRHPANTRRKRKQAASAPELAARKHDGDAEEGDMTPDVLFHKQMTRDKLALLNRSPLAKVLSKGQKDAAAEELFGAGATFDASLRNPDGRQRQDADEAGGEGKKERRKLRRRVRELKKDGRLPRDEREATEVGVMYLGHIPHGFYEKEIMAYFSQYGEVTKVRLSRSKRTARSRGFAFVEFADGEVAGVAAKSMDGYLMHGQKLVAKLVEKEKLHPDTFRGANRVFKKIPFAAIERRKMIQRARDPVKLAKRSKGVQKNLKKKQTMLLKKGIKYEFPAVTLTAEQENTDV